MWLAAWERVWVQVYFSILRPMIKWLTHKITGKCELLRLVYLHPTGAERTKSVEKSLERSRHVELKKLAREHGYNIDEALEGVVRLKHILTDIHMEFEWRMRECLQQISAYNHLWDEVETLRRVKYDVHNPQHEKLLLQLWSLLMPGEDLQSRVSNQWMQLGFQGNDPATDFRGMGLLGLQQLIYFAKHYQSRSQQCLSRAKHPQIGLSYGIVGVNITSIAHHLLKKRKLRTHFYNSTGAKEYTLDDFHEVYCYLFYEFDNYWYKMKPKTIMDFNSVKDKFQKKITTKLKETGIRLQLEVEN